MKKIVAAMLAIAVSACLCASVYAAAPQKVKSLHPDFAKKIFSASLSGEKIPLSSLRGLKAGPGSELDIVLAGRGSAADLFFDQNGKPVNTADVTASKMRATNVEPEIYVSAGAGLIESAEIVAQNAGSPASKPVLRVSFAADFDGLEPERFDFSVYISIGGVRQEQSGINISGTLGNPEVTVDSSDISVYADGFVIIAAENVPRIELQAGHGVFVTASLKKGDRYRVRARADDNPADATAPEKPNTLYEIIALDAAGFDDGDISGVRIESEDRSFSVCDENGNLLGETVWSGDASAARALPLAEKYFLLWRDRPLNPAEIIKPLS